jgi:hypothetical protein
MTWSIKKIFYRFTMRKIKDESGAAAFGNLGTWESQQGQRNDSDHVAPSYFPFHPFCC